MKMYRTQANSLDIQEAEVTSSRRTVTLPDGRKEYIVGAGHIWHNTRRAALEWLHKQAIGKAVQGQRLLNEAAYEIKHVQIELKHLKEEQ
jgi:hypothetical protein